MKYEYEDLWITVKFLLTLSHDQACSGKGYSVNKAVLALHL